MGKGEALCPLNTAPSGCLAPEKGCAVTDGTEAVGWICSRQQTWKSIAAGGHTTPKRSPGVALPLFKPVPRSCRLLPAAPGKLPRHAVLSSPPTAPTGSMHTPAQDTHLGAPNTGVFALFIHKGQGQ